MPTSTLLLRKAYAAEHILAQLRSSMTSPPLVSPQTPLQEAIAHLLPAGGPNSSPPGCLLVVEGEDLRGIVTAHDVLRGWTAGRSCDDSSIAEVMTSPVVTLDESEFCALELQDSVLAWQRVADRFEQHNINYLPLLDDRGGMVGLLHRRDFERCRDARLLGEAITNATPGSLPPTEYGQADHPYLALVQSIPIGIYQFRLSAAGEKSFDYVSAPWAKMNQLDPSEVRQDVTLILDKIHPDDLQSFFHLEEQSHANHNRFVWEGRMIIGAQVRWMRLESLPHLQPNGDTLWYGTQYDITEQKETEKSLKIQRDFNKLIAEITSRFVDLEPEELAGEIQKTLQLIGEITEVDTSYLVEFDPKNDTLSMTYEWCQPHCPRQIALLQQVPRAAFPWALDQIVRREIVYVPNLEDLPPEAEIDRASWQRFNLRAVLSVPLIQQSSVTGLLGFASFSQPMTWQEETLNLLRVMGQTIATAQERLQDQHQLLVSEERLRLALAAAKQGFYDMNLQTGKAVVSPEYALMLGYDPATFEETHARWLKRLHPDDRDRIIHLCQVYLAGEAPEYNAEFRERTQTGDWKWMLSRGKIVEWDATGKPLRMLGTHTDISDRKQIEDALRDSEARFRAFMEHNPAAAWITSAEGKMEYVNPTYEKLFLVSRNVLGRHISELYPPEIAQVYLDNIQAVARTQQVVEAVEPGLRVDGSQGEFWVFKFPLPQHDGTLAVGGVAIDITEKLQAEQLRRELTLIERIFELILAGYWDWNLTNGTEYLSPRFKHMFGYEDHELENSPETWQRMIFTEDLPGVMSCLDRHIASHGQIPFYIEVRYRHKDGSTVWVICSGRVIEWDSAGQAKRMIGCHIDITERKQAEEKLRKSDAHLKAAQRIGKLGSWEFDLESGTITWSEEVFALFGRDPQHGTPTYEELQQTIHPDDLQQHNFVVQRAITEGQSYNIDVRIYRPDRSLRYLLGRGEVITDTAGNSVRLLGTVMDITDRKRAEAKLYQTTTQLQASNHELEAFAYSVSHDLRSPLRAIDGYSQALVEDYGEQLNEEARDYLDRIQFNIKRMGILIDDLLNLSRISRSEMDYRLVDLSALVVEQLQELQTLDPTRSVEIKVAPELQVYADKTLMQVAMSNLIQNAWKFTSHHATAHIEFGAMQQKGNTVYFIRDDGAGFDMTYANMLFGVFQRLHDTHEFPGTGVGLATVQRAIHRHGGKIWAEGAIEQGATIYFTLPSFLAPETAPGVGP